MKLKEIIPLITDQTQLKILDQHSMLHAKDLTELLTDQEDILCIWNGMSPEEREVIQFFLAKKGSSYLTYREIELPNIILPNGKVSFRIGLTRLRRKGIIYTLRRTWGELAFVIPDELIRSFRMIIVPLRSSWEVKPCTLPNNLSYHILDDMLQALNNVKNRPLLLTKKGYIQRKSLNSLFEGVRICEETVEGLEEKSLHHPFYKPHEVLLLGILGTNQLLECKEDKIYAGDVTTFVSNPFPHLQKCLLEAFSKHLDLDTRLQFLFDIMTGLTEGTIYSLQEIIQSMDVHAPDYHTAYQKLVAPLATYGFIHTLQKEDSDVSWKWNEGREIQDGFYIQPNFELLVPSFATVSLRWEISTFASYLKKSEMLTFKLSKESIRPYFDEGRTDEELLSFIQKKSLTPIPENIAQAVRDWYNEHKQVSFFDARLMKVKDPRMADEIVQIPSIAECLLTRVGDCYFSVDLTKWDQLVAELEGRGLSATALQGLMDKREPKKPFSLYDKQDEIQEYKVDSVFPELEDAFPGLRELPKMWLANYQRYHGSTLRELIQKAIQLNLQVKLEKDGAEYVLQLDSLTNHHGYWTVIGQDPHGNRWQGDLEHIDKIQISLPF
jgi:hypothetical protein